MWSCVKHCHRLMYTLLNGGWVLHSDWCGLRRELISSSQPHVNGSKPACSTYYPIRIEGMWSWKLAAPDWFLNCMVVLRTVRVTSTGGVSLRQQMLLPLTLSNGILKWSRVSHKKWIKILLSCHDLHYITYMNKVFRVSLSCYHTQTTELLNL